MLLSRQPVLHTHDELYMQTLIDESAVHKPSCTVDVGSKISIAGSTLSFRICSPSRLPAAQFSWTLVGKFTEPVESEAMSGLR